VAAARAGYTVVGIDPSLGAVMAARRVAAALGAPVRYVVGDARRLPFATTSFDVTYSYSVLQHFSRADAKIAVGEMGRVLKPGGLSKVQMPTRWGLRCAYQQLRRGFREGREFEVRYWTPGELRHMFSAIGPSRVEADCYFGIGLQRADELLMPPLRRQLLQWSERLKVMSRRYPALAEAADSVFVECIKAVA
jgi:SAM-dependent methyltransferase